jgi:glutathione S-transferase
MKLYGTPRSPYARKVRIVLAEKNIPYELIVTRGSTPDSPVPALNPLGKVPTLQRDDGRALYDSPVIVEYLDGLGSGPKLIPEDFESRIEVKRWEALGDGVTEATVAVNHERLEPAEKQHNAEWFARRQAKIDLGLALMERDLETAYPSPPPRDLATCSTQDRGSGHHRRQAFARKMPVPISNPSKPSPSTRAPSKDASD